MAYLITKECLLLFALIAHCYLPYLITNCEEKFKNRIFVFNFANQGCEHYPVDDR